MIEVAETNHANQAGVGGARYSVSKSQAEGLVTRLVSEWDEAYRLHFEPDLKPGRFRPTLTPLPTKRAAAYRVMRERS